jgi:long-subunit fatty acid transport protein
VPNLRCEIGYTQLFVVDGSLSDISGTGDLLVGSFDNSGDLFGISMQYKF